MGSMEEEPTLRDPVGRQFSDIELQILAMARALAPGILPVLAAVAASARHGAPLEGWQGLLSTVHEMDDPRRLPFPSYDPVAKWREQQREAGWHAIVAFALTVAAGREDGLSFRDAAQAWRQAHTGNAHPTPNDAPPYALSPPLPLRQSAACEILAFTDGVFARLLSSPDPRVREWAATHAHFVEVSRQFTDRELQILAMARALAPELMPALAAGRMLAASGAKKEADIVFTHVVNAADPRQLFPAGSDEARRSGGGWQGILVLAVGVAEDEESSEREDTHWRQAHSASHQMDRLEGIADGHGPSYDPGPDKPAPLTQDQAQAMLAFTGEVLRYLLEYPDASVRTWTVANINRLGGHLGPSGPEIGPQTAV